MSEMDAIIAELRTSIDALNRTQVLAERKKLVTADLLALKEALRGAPGD